MSKKLFFIPCISVVMMMLVSCNRSKPEEIICTMEFRTIGIQVNGNTLDTCYTVRLTNNDTIWPNTQMVLYDHLYPVLTDMYQPHLVNQLDSFRFCGYLQGMKVVDEIFKIKADECHIDYVSGKTEVTL